MNSYIIVPITDDTAVHNFNNTVYKPDLSIDHEGYWTIPKTGGEKTEINDTIIFHYGKNINSSIANRMLAVGIVTNIVSAKTHIHTTLRQQWIGDWNTTEENIIIFSILPNMIKMDYTDLLKCFSSGTRMYNGAIRLDPINGTINGAMSLAMNP